jgi:hypothetical protein
MPSTLNPFGLRPVYHPSGEANIETKKGQIPSAYSSQINQYQPVLLLATSGTIAPSTASGDAILGVFLGCEFTPAGGRPTFSNFWPASTSLQTGVPAIAYYTDDPVTVYEIQATGSAAQSTQGKEYSISNFTATNGLGFSACTLNLSSTATAGGNAQLRVVDKGLGPDNDWSDTYTVLRVTISNYQYGPTSPSL